jgi:hypothetical protein
MPNTFELIASVTVGSGGAASMDFTSIPSTYTDLCFVSSLRASDNSDYCSIRFNNSSSSFSSRQIYNTGSTTRANNDLTAATVPSTYTANTFSSNLIYIPNYAGSSNKSWSRDSVFENNAAAAVQTLEAGLWANTAAINQVTLVHPTANFAQYSTAYLYGVKNA